MAEHEEYQYLNLIRRVLDTGSFEPGRNGTTVSVFGASMRFSLENGVIPILTTKRTAWKTCLKELLWFIRGETDNNILNDNDVHIWDGNASADFMASRGLSNYPQGILGPIYGYQWRNFNAAYDPATGKPATGKHATDGVDQLQQIIDELKDPARRNSRRLIMTAWNPSQLDQMALPPCHILCQFNVHRTNKLSCALYQRSGDIGLGVPFNIASYSFLTHLIAKHCGLEPFEFVYFLGNAHIYDDHIDSLKEQLERTPEAFPTVQIGVTRKNISDYNVSDFEISNYKCHEPIIMKMRK
jgi:thymidylate synthase